MPRSVPGEARLYYGESGIYRNMKGLPEIRRHPGNPIVRPGIFPWRRAATFNPGVIYDQGRFLMLERAAGSFAPFNCSFGALESVDGVAFRHVRTEPVFTPGMAGSEYGSVQDPRLVKIDGVYYMTFAFRPYAWSCHPTGVGVPRSEVPSYPGFDPKNTPNQTRSGLAVSKNLTDWEMHSWITPGTIDDRDVILFPEKVGGRYAVLRRPVGFVGTDTGHGSAHPGIMISFSDDLGAWSPPEMVAAPEYDWEDNRIGGSAPPIRTANGWLVLYHGVETLDPAVNRVCYRMGAMLLDLDDPRRVTARCPHFIMEPGEYYEKHGAFIPNVIFPTAAPVVDGIVHIYYGVCDTAIALATVPLVELVDYVASFKTGSML